MLLHQLNGTVRYVLRTVRFVLWTERFVSWTVRFVLWTVRFVLWTERFVSRAERFVSWAVRFAKNSCTLCERLTRYANEMGVAWMLWLRINWLFRYFRSHSIIFICFILHVYESIYMERHSCLKVKFIKCELVLYLYAKVISLYAVATSLYALLTLLRIVIISLYSR